MNEGNARLLNISDIHLLEWTGSKSHLEYIRSWFKKSDKGEMDLIALEQGDELIAFGCIDYTMYPDSGFLMALTVKEDIRSHGFGTQLIEFAQQLIKDKNKSKITLHVETFNDRAISLYERLGYKTIRETTESWEEISKEGKYQTYHAKVFLMEKEI